MAVLCSRRSNNFAHTNYLFNEQELCSYPPWSKVYGSSRERYKTQFSCAYCMLLLMRTNNEFEHWNKAQPFVLKINCILIWVPMCVWMNVLQNMGRLVTPKLFWTFQANQRWVLIIWKIIKFRIVIHKGCTATRCTDLMELTNLCSSISDLCWIGCWSNESWGNEMKP